MSLAVSESLAQVGCVLSLAQANCVLSLAQAGHVEDHSGAHCILGLYSQSWVICLGLRLALKTQQLRAANSCLSKCKAACDLPTAGSRHIPRLPVQEQVYKDSGGDLLTSFRRRPRSHSICCLVLCSCS